VDTGHTQVLWQVNHMGFSKYDGQFGGVTGTLQLDPAKPSAARLSVTIPMTGLTTMDAALNKHLSSPDFFDATKFPSATFTSTKIVAKGKAARITGNLTVHGITRPVTLEARFIGAGTGMMPPRATNVGFEATTMLKRSEFGLGYGVPVVSDQVELRINAAFEKVPG
jgi:polyisoprenoid-binding protein YceI